MTEALIIVESPTKVKTLSKFLGREYTVKASVGHVKDLPSNRLGVDVAHEFAPEYITIEGKEKILSEIKKVAKRVKIVYLAPDPDREGEAISWHIANELKTEKNNFQIYRVLFNEITKRAVLQALAKPGQIDEHKVNAQQARRILDRLVGYKISPILWRKVRWGLSAGRVQSVAVRLICERERDIRNFVSEEYWTVTAHLEGSVPPPFTARLIRIGDLKAKIHTGEEAQNIVNDIQKQEFRISGIDRKKKKKQPVAPFTTSKLQQEAFRKLRFPAKKTMLIAQRLYEGIELGDEGSVGLITYMRTDSTRIAEESMAEAREYIGSRFGTEYLPGRPRLYKNKSLSQDAHEAIRPTAVIREPDKIKSYLKPEEFRLYQLVWSRFVASQMKDAVIDQTMIDLQAGRYLFRVTGSIVVFKGFTKLYEEGRDETSTPQGDEADPSSPDNQNQLPNLAEGEIVSLGKLEPKQHFTQPSPRFSDASLVKELEEKGIGRPSTYATILSTIVNREYVVKDNKGKFSPTELGMLVNGLLVDSFPEVLDVEFTAQMETKLDEIEEGKRDWVNALHFFYESFTRYVKTAERNMRDVKREGILTEIVCDKCGRKMAIKWGRNGEFLSCSGYPECKNAREFQRGENDEILVKGNDYQEKKCDKCGSPMVLKHSRFGSFLACSAYPSCKYTVPVDKASQRDQGSELVENEKCEKCGAGMQVKVGPYGRFLSCTNYPQCKFIKPINIGISCPESGCGGYLTERRTRKGKIFYSCSNYPKCTFSLWQKPIPEKCPTCGFPFLLQAKGKVVCGSKNCDYSDER
ncbi:MAG: type I DNA topoisomerase [bacterium]